MIERWVSILNYDTGIRILAMAGIAMMLMAKQYKHGGWLGCLIISIVAFTIIYYFVYKPSKNKDNKNQREK